MERTAGYLGPSGSYSELATKKLCAGFTLTPYKNFRAIFSALSAGEIDEAVVPIENSLNGAVTQNLDLLEEFKDVTVVAQCPVLVDHRIITLNGASYEGVERIYSHPQALAQCAKYLSEKFPTACQYATSSTSESLSMIKTPSDAGIVGAHVVREGFTLSAQTISDEKTNFTFFFKIVKGKFTLPAYGAKRLFFCFTCLHRPGALISMLNVLAEHNINMTKIESRPIKEKLGEFRFFIEIELGDDRKSLATALKEIEEKSLSFRIFGAY
ncbi:MAG: prephenate dehydratase [Candidatus Coproplasma sp.]